MDFLKIKVFETSKAYGWADATKQERTKMKRKARRGLKQEDKSFRDIFREKGGVV